IIVKKLVYPSYFQLVSSMNCLYACHGCCWDSSASRSSVTQSSAQLPISSLTGANALPFSVNEYSIRTGNSENTFLSTICSFSSIFNRSDSNRPLMGKSLSISEKRFFPFNSSDKMSPTQRVLNNCIAFSNRG